MMQTTTRTKSIIDLLKETNRLKKAVSQRERFIARLICENFKEEFSKNLPLGALFLLDLEVQGLTGITIVEYLSYHEIQILNNHQHGHDIIELTLDLPQSHLLRVTPIDLIKKGIAVINETKDLNIIDSFGFICSPRKNEENIEFLNPKIKSFNLKCHFNLEKYISC